MATGNAHVTIAFKLTQKDNYAVHDEPDTMGCTNPTSRNRRPGSKWR